jgi:DNA repair exonuclease SbcCD ATPase subunit
MSFGKEAMEVVFQNGITFVTGFNHDENSYNGVGKTALIIESLSFVLFGEAYRSILKGQIANWDINDTCSVDLWLEINEVPYYISRSANPSKLVFEEDGVPIQKTAPETNKDIIQKLGVSKDIFNNTLAMTNDTSVAFLRQKVTAVKTKFVEGILSLELYAKIFDKTKDQYKAQDKEVDSAEIRIEELKKSLAQDRQYRTTEEQKKKDEINKYEEQIAEIETTTKQIDNSVLIQELTTDVAKNNQELSDINAKYSELRLKETEVESDQRNEQKELDKFNKIRTECPTCKRPMGDHNPEDIEKEKAAIQKKIDKFDEQLAKINTAKKAINNKIVTIENSTRKLNSTISTLQTEQKAWDVAMNKIQGIKQMLENVKAKTNVFEDKIKKNEETLKEYEEKLANLKFKLRIYELSKVAGTLIKANAIKKIIGTMNNRLNYYLKRLGAVVTIQFDEFFEEKLIHKRNKQEISYGSLSGGEMKRVDVALLFAFRDIRRLQSQVSLNISVFDELFDSAIDAKAMQDIMTLLKEMSDKEGFYIITHRAENVEVETCNVIRLEKRNGITKITK